MFSKKVTALAAGALLVATSSAAVAQGVPAANTAAPLSLGAMLQSGDDAEGSGSTTAIAVIFVLVVAAILIATAGGGDKSPSSP